MIENKKIFIRIGMQKSVTTLILRNPKCRVPFL